MTGAGPQQCGGINTSRGAGEAVGGPFGAGILRRLSASGASARAAPGECSSPAPRSGVAAIQAEPLDAAGAQSRRIGSGVNKAASHVDRAQTVGERSSAGGPRLFLRCSLDWAARRALRAIEA